MIHDFYSFVLGKSVYALSNSYKKNEFTKITVLQVIFSSTIFFEVEPKTAIFLEKRLILSQKCKS